MSIKNYFDKFNVLGIIDCNSIIHLKDGSSLKGDIFINDLYKYIENYNDFNELFNDMVLFIEY